MTLLDVPIRTMDELLHALGDVPASRVRVNPPPGMATVADLLDIHAREKRLCELVDGTLVEKPMGYRESIIAVALASLLRAFVVPRNLGIVTGESGMMRLFAGLVRIPDVAFASWNRLANKRVPEEPVPALVPDLAIEIISQGNTPAEMKRKREEYFQAGVSEVWMVDIVERTVTIFTAVDRFTMHSQDQNVAGSGPLAGLTISLPELFSELDRTEQC